MKILYPAELQEEHHVRLHEAVVRKPHLAEALLLTVLGWADTIHSTERATMAE